MYWVADTITRIKNANILNKKTVSVRGTKFCLSILDVLKEQGYIKGFSCENDLKQTCVVELAYYNKQPLVKNVKHISTPKSRQYRSWKDLPRYMNGYKTLIVSTNEGVMSGVDAVNKQIGGEVLFWIRSF